MRRIQTSLRVVLLLLLASTSLIAGEFRIQGKDIELLDSGTGAVLDLLRLEGVPESLLLSPDGTRLFVRLKNENSIAEFDATTLELLSWVSLDRSWRGKEMDTEYWSIDPKDGKLLLRDIDGNLVYAEEYREELRRSEPLSFVPMALAAGAEFTLSQSSGTKGLPSADYDGSGNIAVTWTDLVGNDGSGEGVFGREFSSSGNAENGELPVNKAKNGNQGNSTLGASSNGDYVIAYRDDNGLDGDSIGVFFRRFSNGGAPKDGNDMLVNNTTNGLQREPSLDAQPDGDFVIVWTGPNGSKKSIFGRRFFANGSPKGNEFVIASSSNEYAPDVATHAGGRFAVVWRDGADDLLRIRVYNNAGSPVTSEFKVDNSTSNQFAPSIAMDQNGNFTVTWQTNASGGIQYRQFNADGSPRGNTRSAGGGGNKDYSPSISMEPGGRFCIAWRDDLLRAWVRTFNSNGDPLQGEFQPAQSGGEQLEVNCALSGNMDFLVSWKHRAGGGNGSIHGRLFGSGATPGLSASCSATPQQGNAPLAVQFTSQGIGGGGTYAYSWNFGDGSSSSVQSPAHTYATNGSFTSTVTVTSGAETATCSKIISVGQAPPPPPPPGGVTVTELSDPTVNRGASDVLIAVKGTGFQEGATVSFLDGGVQVFFTNWVDATKIRVRINVLPSAFLGYHHVQVKNPNGSQAVGVALLQVLQGGGYPPPVVLALDPVTVNAGSTLVLRILGQEFAHDPQLAFLGTDFVVNAVAWISSTEVRANVTIPASLTCGPRNVQIANGPAVSAPCISCISVASSTLNIGAVFPPSILKNSGPTDVTILGCGFTPSSVAKIKDTERISQTFVNSTTIILRVRPKPDATRGAKTVKVINPDGVRVRRKDLFSIQ